MRPQAKLFFSDWSQAFISFDVIPKNAFVARIEVDSDTVVVKVLLFIFAD